MDADVADQAAPKPSVRTAHTGALSEASVELPEALSLRARVAIVTGAVLYET